MKNKLSYCNVRFVFQTKCKTSNFFTFKDKIPLFLRSGTVYKFQCGSSNATYYGKTKMMMILPLENMFYFAITHLVLKISPFLLPTTTTLKLR